MLGAPVFTYHVEGDGPHIPEGAALVQLTDDPAAAARAPVGLAIVTDLKLGIRALLAASAPRTAGTRAAGARRTRARRPAHRPLSDAADRRAAARGSIVVEEAPSSRSAMHDYLPMLEPRLLLYVRERRTRPRSAGGGRRRPRAPRPQGASASSATARPCTRSRGCGAPLSSPLPVTFVIVNNGSYRALNAFAPHFGLAALPGTLLPHLDFCALARAQGVEAVRVSRCADLDAALRMAFGAAGPVLIEVCVAD